MERTRIVHYTHSKTPVVFTPMTFKLVSPSFQPSSRLSSSTSLSSLVSNVTDKAPLACIDSDNQSKPRRMSKSGDQCSIRSSSTGRLKDEAFKLHTSVYTAVLCQDYPVPPNDFGSKKRPKSESIPHSPLSVISSKHSVDTTSSYGTLDSCSRSRRQRPSEVSYGGSERHALTLPLKIPGKTDSPVSDTLVKCRRRYTWLSSKTLNPPQTPTTPTSPASERDLTKRRFYPDSPVPTAVTSASPAPNAPTAVTPDDRVPKVPTAVTADTPSTEELRESDIYNWKRDPRRRPHHFDETFDLDPPLPPLPLPSESSMAGSFDKEPMKDYIACDKGYSSPGSDKRYHSPILSPKSSVTESDPENPRRVEFQKCNTNSYNSTSSFRNTISHFGHEDIREQKSTVGRFLEDELCHQGLSSLNIGHSPSDLNLNSNTNVREVVRTPNSNSSSKHCHYQTDRNVNGEYYSPSLERHNNRVTESKCPPMSRENSKESNFVMDFSSPRARNSFKMALENTLTEFPPVLMHPSLLPKKSNGVFFSSIAQDMHSRRHGSNEDDVFINGHEIPSNQAKSQDKIVREYNSRLSESMNYDSSPKHEHTLDYVNVPEHQSDSKDDVLTRRIKRNSLRLATSSLSDLTCAMDDIDINQRDAGAPRTLPIVEEERHSPNSSMSMSPFHRRTNLSRTGSCISSQNSSSFRSFYSCQGIGAISTKNSSSHGSHRAEIIARFDSPGSSRFNRSNYDLLSTGHGCWERTFPRSSSSRNASPSSTSSSNISNQHPKTIFYWTRQTPYPRLLRTRSTSVALSQASRNHQRKHPPQPPITSSIHSNGVQHQCTNRKNSIPDIQIEKSPSGQGHRLSQDRCDESIYSCHSSSSRPIIDRNSMTLPLSPLVPHSTDRHFDYYSSDLSPVIVGDIESPTTVRSPPSLGRPRRKQYAGFDSQPLPMDSFLSDSSSVYTCMSCSSRATDMTGQPENCQFDESFISEDVHSVFDDSCGDISFHPSETLSSDLTLCENRKDIVNVNLSKCESVHSTSTAKRDHGDSSLEDTSREDTSREDSSLHNTSCDDFIETSQNNALTPKASRQFGSEYDALFRLYKSDDLIGNDMFTSPSYPRFLQNGKAFSSSCLLRSTLYSKRKFLSTRDIFDLIRHSDKTPLDVTMSLTSLERQANRVCEAILCCGNDMEQGLFKKETHSLV